MGAGRQLPEWLSRLDRTFSFVGRETEVAALERAWEEAKRGTLRIATVAGEPGIGKTRIAGWLAERAYQDGAVVLYGHSDQELAIPVQPIAEAFGEYAATAPQEEIDRLQSQASILGRVVPAIRTRLPGVQLTDISIEEPAEQYELFQAASELLSAAARRGPLLLVIDDLQWADRPTALMLRYLVSSPDSPAGMIVATYRAAELERGSTIATTLADLERQAGIFSLNLKGLTREEALALATAAAGHELDPRAAELVRMVHVETGGNPLFVTQLLRNLGEAGAFSEVAGRWELQRQLDALDLPGSVTETVRRRVARLGETAEEVLSTAALIGSEFDASLLEETSEHSPEEVRGVLDRAARAGIVSAGEEGRPFAFAHPLITRVLYESIGTASRGVAHSRVALVLEDRLAEGAGVRPGEVARHCVAAAPPDRDKVVAWAKRAGEAALEQFEAEAAARWFSTALEFSGEEEDAAYCDLLIGLGVSQRMSGDGAFRETLLRAARLAASLEDAERLVTAALANHRGFVSASGTVDSERIAVLELALEKIPDEDSPARARLLATLAAELSFSGEWDRRLALSDEALEMTRRLGNLHALSDVLTERFVPIWMPETLAERLSNSEENVRIADQIGRPLEQFRAVHWHSVALVQGGRLEEATEAVKREDEIAKRLGDPTALWIATYDRGNLALIFGRLEEAEELANEAFRIATESEQPDALSFFGSQIGNVRYEQGRLAELQELLAKVVAENPGIPAFRAVLALAYTEGGMLSEAGQILELEAESEFADIPRDVTWLAGHTIYAHVCATLDARSPAALLYERLLPWADQIVYTGISAWGDGDHALGRLALTLGDLDSAEGHLEASRIRAHTIGATVWAVRASIDLARALLRRGSPAEMDRAAELLEAATTEARRLGVERLASRAEGVAAHARAQHVIAGSDGATARLQMRPRSATATASTARTAPAERRGVLRRAGDRWSISYGGKTIRLRSRKGMRYLAELLVRPGIERHAVELQSGGTATAARVPSHVASSLSVRRAGDSHAGPMLDERAKRAYRQRLEELEDEIGEAEAFNDLERISKAKEEREQIGRALSAAIGLGGQDRKMASDAERARLNVTRCIQRTVEQISSRDAELGEHLRESVTTGAFCVYAPPPGESLAWEVEKVDGQ